jgi:hypothetical protein
LDKVATAISLACIVFDAGNPSGAGQACSSLSSRDRPDRQQRFYVGVVGELLKLVLVERLFSLTRDNLMKIPAFAGHIPYFD